MFVSSDIFSGIGDLPSTLKGKFSFLSFDTFFIIFWNSECEIFFIGILMVVFANNVISWYDVVCK